MRWPWHRVRDATERACAAEQRADDARTEHAEVAELAEQYRTILQKNGFATMIRIAMGARDEH